MQWNSELYQKNHDYVAEYGKALLEYVPCVSGQRILDVGCGTGTLAYALSKKSSMVIGIDSAEAMVEKARTLYPDIEFQVMSACDLPWQGCFNIVFSNAVFHWISEQEILLRKIYAALKDGGRLVCEFGACGNIAVIQKSFRNVVAGYGHAYTNPFFFPTAEEYRKRLEGAGFHVDVVRDYDRPTPLKEGRLGLANWLRQFFATELHAFSPELQKKIVRDVEDAAGELWDGARWIADYRRLQVLASK